MLRAGHAENALPQSATATVNCRVFPGVPVAEIEQVLRQVVGNEAIEFKQLDEATESPISEYVRMFSLPSARLCTRATRM